MILQGQIGSINKNADGSLQNVRQGNQDDMIVSELHGRFYEQNYRTNTFCSGMTTTSISNATFTTSDALSGTLATAATATPIVGIYNPLASTVNAVILQAVVTGTLTALTTTGPGSLVWCIFTGNGAVSTGNNPINRKTLASTGSECKGLSGLALTGLSNVGILLGGSAISIGSPYNTSEVGTAAGFHTQQIAQVENFDGSLIVPPGGVLGLFATTTPVALSAASNLLWEEVPV
jgi:hypothetical protein